MVITRILIFELLKYWYLKTLKIICPIEIWLFAVMIVDSRSSVEQPKEDGLESDGEQKQDQESSPSEAGSEDAVSFTKSVNSFNN